LKVEVVEYSGSMWVDESGRIRVSQGCTHIITLTRHLGDYASDGVGVWLCSQLDAEGRVDATDEPRRDPTSFRDLWCVVLWHPGLVSLFGIG
jgi:hypothetical protein